MPEQQPESDVPAAPDQQTTVEQSPSARPALRLWPTWLCSLLMLISMVLTVSAQIDNRTRFMIMMAGPLLSGVLFSISVLLLSRLSIREKLKLTAVAIAAPLICYALCVQESPLYTALWVYAVPLAIFTTTGGLTYFARSATRIRNTSLLLLAGWMVFPLLRVDGFDGEYYAEFFWRWTPVHEQTLPALPELQPREPAFETTDVPDAKPAGEWPRFRGPDENGISTASIPPLDWNASPPELLWKIPIGPGWSSFSCRGNRLFTQEQRGDREYVTCYDAATGELIWSHSDTDRFEEVVSGAGPRSTPSVEPGFVYALGGRGLLTCLQESTGSVVWQRDFQNEFSATVPMWGFSGSPHLINDLLVIYVGGPEYGLTAFHKQTGEVVWSFASSGMNYTTVRSATFADQNCLLFCDGAGLHAINPVDGSEIWSYRPNGFQGTPMVDPQVTADGDLIMALGDGAGLTRLHVSTQAEDDAEWQISEVWTSRFLRPSFNDSLLLDDLIFGFNQNIYSCIDASTGKRLWHGGRYKFGQAVMLQQSRQVIVAAEQGFVVLLQADPDRLTELGRVEVLDGKTWNHPIIANGCLYVRNATHAACLRLAEPTTGVADIAAIPPTLVP